MLWQEFTVPSTSFLINLCACLPDLILTFVYLSVLAVSCHFLGHLVSHHCQDPGDHIRLNPEAQAINLQLGRGGAKVCH